VAALGDDAKLAEDARFATVAARSTNDDVLADILSHTFATRPAADWEQRLTSADVGCVEVEEEIPQRLFQTDPVVAAEYTDTVTSALFEEHLRLDAPVRFSRSRPTLKGFGLAGEDTDAILTELGYDAGQIAGLRERNVVA
jgi:crotonobetainyl-CoA:carnitine CoA-transferase CaiB-like acyl-CoA transferase